MIAAIEARGFSPKDHNEADAIALLLMFESKTTTEGLGDDPCEGDRR
jgi:hypothetical protein